MTTNSIGPEVRPPTVGFTSASQDLVSSLDVSSDRSRSTNTASMTVPFSTVGNQRLVDDVGSSLTNASSAGASAGSATYDPGLAQLVSTRALERNNDIEQANARTVRTSAQSSSNNFLNTITETVMGGFAAAGKMLLNALGPIGGIIGGLLAAIGIPGS